MVLAAVAMAFTFVVVMLGILDRQFALGLRGLDAYAGYGIASALFLAMPGTLQRGEHIRVTLLLQRLSPGLRHAAGVVVHAGRHRADLGHWPTTRAGWCGCRT
jgi:TRAP-type C4-dicarboxylate transport system permease small subunit